MLATRKNECKFVMVIFQQGREALEQIPIVLS